jgi:hypothetical protein
MGTLSANFLIHGYNFQVPSGALALRPIYCSH